MDTITIGVIIALFFLYMYLYQRKYAEMYVSYDSGVSDSDKINPTAPSESY